MTDKIKRRSLRCGGRPKADFGSIFTTFIAPALGVAGSVADSAISKAQASKSNIKPAVKETNTEVTNNNSVENLPTTQAPTKEPISGLVTSNTVIPPDPTKTPTMRLGGRKKCWIGAAITGATSIAGSLFGAAAQKREMRRQKSIKDWQDTTQEAANMTSALNNSQDYQEDYLRQFRTAARLGKTLGAKGIYITDGGDATKIDNNNTYLLRGGSHEDVNETGQTGIGINVGGNEVEAEGGEVAQKKNGALRIFSAQPILGNGMSPAQAILRGYNKDKVFNQQQAFKKRNGLKDDGSKARIGTAVPYKRIHINEDGTFTDTLNNKNYTTSATNGEDVVITGKANHWKEAGKKDTSSYFDPMGAVNFVTAAGAPILNANPSNIIGSIRDSKNAGDFLKHYMMQDTGGFVNTKWAKEHPYLSLGINTVGDIGLGYGLGKAGVGLYRLRPSNLRKHIFENISPIGYDKPIPRIKEALKSALSGAEADIDNPSWFNRSSAYDLGTYNTASVSRFPEHALEARFDAWRKYLGLPQKFNTWTKSPIVKGAYTDEKGISKLKRLPLDQSIDFVNSAGGNVANEIEEFATRGARGQKYGVSHIRDTWDLQPWSRLEGNIIENKLIRPLYNDTIGKVNLKLSSILHKVINKYGYDNEAIQKYLNETGEAGLDNLADVVELFADTKSMKGKLAHKLEGLDDILKDKYYYISNRDTKLNKLTNKLSNKIKKFEPSSLLPGAKPFNIAYDIPWTNEVFPNNEMIKGFNMIDNLPTEAYRYKLKNPLLNYKYRLGGRCKLRNGGLTSKDRGSSKHPYPSVSSKDFAGGGRSYPIPTRADAVDALRLAGLHGRSDVKAKVYNKYPSLRKKARGGTVVEPYYDWARNTSSNLGISFIDPTYDYRAYYNSVTPYERNLVRFAPQGTHFTDIGKTIKHPTFSNESKYSNKKTPGGTWNGNVFVPAIWQFGNNGNAIRNKYMKGSGEGYFNGTVDVFPTYRKKHSLGGRSSRPVEGMRPKAAIGIHVPFNKRYTSIYDAPDYDDINGGNVLGNKEVTVTAKRIKPTFLKPNNDAMDIINHPANETPYIPQKHNRSRTIFSGGDYLGLGIDTLSALGTGLVNYKTAGNYVLPDRAPVIQASKLPTTYNVAPEIEEVKRYRDRLTGETYRNTSSSVAALNRSGAINLDALSNLSKLWATKENEENKMLTEDAKNQQTVAAQNVQNELARQSEIARIKNEATQAKGDAFNVGLSGLSQAWTNFWTAGRTAYEDDQSRRAMIASSKEATPTRLSEMDFDLSPDILASLYRTAKDDRTKRFYLSRLSPKQRLKYGIN